MKLTARSILSTSPAELEANLTVGVKYLVEYEDGVTLAQHKQSIILDRYCWELFLLTNPLPIPSSCSSISVIKDGYYSSNVPPKLLETIFKYICEQENIVLYRDKEKYLKRSYEVINMILNEIVHRKLDYCTTIDAVDFIQVINDPEIKAIHENLKPTPDSVEAAYKGIRNYVHSKRSGVKRRFVNAYRCKAVNDNQANQCIGPRGFVTRLDRVVLRQPITSGFIRGMKTLYEIIAESLTAVKSINANDTQIQTSEYASRRIQLLGMVVTRVDNLDCGSQEYLPVLLTDKYLGNMKGIWYCTEPGQPLSVINGNEKHLLGEMIYIRSAFGCRSPDPQHVCIKCLGDLSTNFPDNSNVGYTMVSFLMEKLTQAILSTKHLTHSVKKSAIRLSGDVNKYFYTNDNNDIFFHPSIDLSKTYIELPISQMKKLIDVLNLTHSNVALNKVGNLEIVGIITNGKRGPVKESVNISYRDRLSNITREFLNHIRSSDYTVNDRGNVTVPMAGFNVADPVFNNQMKETNIVAFVHKISSIIEVTGKNKLTLEEHFFNLCDVVFDQFQCNFSILQAIVYATTAYNAKEGNFRLGRNSPHAIHARKADLFRSRSAAQLLVYQGAKTELLKHPTVLFSEENRMDHPMDVLFAPKEVINQYHRDKK